MSRDVHEKLIVIDAEELSNWDRDLIEGLRVGGLTCANVTTATWEDARTTLDNIGHFYRLAREHSDILTLARSGEDILAAKEQEKTAFILGFQNSSPFEDDLALVEVFHALGVRIVQLTYNNQNFVGGSCYEENDSGLSRFGHNVIREMNRLGMLIDLSHVGERTSLETMAFSSRPVAITHSNPRWHYEHKRNKSGKVLQALVDCGGVLGLCILPHLHGGPTIMREFTLTGFCELVARTVEFMGIDHVGIGTDLAGKHTSDRLKWIHNGRWAFERNYGSSWPGVTDWPEWFPWFNTARDFPNLTAGLLDYGFTEEEAAKIMGGNWHQLFTDSFKPT